MVTGQAEPRLEAAVAHEAVGDVERADAGAGHVVPEGEAEVGDARVDGDDLRGQDGPLARPLGGARLDVDVLAWSQHNTTASM